MKIFNISSGNISKVTSEDCVAWIIANMAPNSVSGDWKRRNKKKIGNYIVREFENVKLAQFGSNAIVKVYEINGQIVPEPSNPSSSEADANSSGGQVYYVIAKNTMEEDFNSVLLLVTNALEFNTYGRQSDNTPDGVIEELSNLGYDAEEMTESVLELWGDVNINELKSRLASSSFFEFSSNFQAFMMEGGMGDMEIVAM